MAFITEICENVFVQVLYFYLSLFPWPRALGYFQESIF